MIRRPPRSTLFPTRRSSDLLGHAAVAARQHLAHGGIVVAARDALDRKSTRLNSSHGYISYAVFCLKKKKKLSTTHSLKQLAGKRTSTSWSCVLCSTDRYSRS